MTYEDVETRLDKRLDEKRGQTGFNSRSNTTQKSAADLQDSLLHAFMVRGKGKGQCSIIGSLREKCKFIVKFIVPPAPSHVYVTHDMYMYTCTCCSQEARGGHE
jgi:hypothetical protein